MVLPPQLPRAGNHVSCVVLDEMAYVGGHGPIAWQDIICGKVGADLSLEDGRRAAHLSTLAILATLQSSLGDLDRIERIVKVFGMVNVAPGFNDITGVIDGCTDLLVEVFGEAGRHTRSVIGLAELPYGTAVQIDLTARLRSD